MRSKLPTPSAVGSAVHISDGPAASSISTAQTPVMMANRTSVRFRSGPHCSMARRRYVGAFIPSGSMCTSAELDFAARAREDGPHAILFL
jgi:hypothetical protein